MVFSQELILDSLEKADKVKLQIPRVDDSAVSRIDRYFNSDRFRSLSLTVKRLEDISLSLVPDSDMNVKNDHPEILAVMREIRSIADRDEQMAESIKNLASIFLGERIPYATKLNLKPGQVIVCVDNPNAHDYDIGKPTIVSSNRPHRKGIRLRYSRYQRIPSRRNLLSRLDLSECVLAEGNNLPCVSSIRALPSHHVKDYYQLIRYMIACKFRHEFKCNPLAEVNDQIVKKQLLWIDLIRNSIEDQFPTLSLGGM